MSDTTGDPDTTSGGRTTGRRLLVLGALGALGTAGVRAGMGAGPQSAATTPTLGPAVPGSSEDAEGLRLATSPEWHLVRRTAHGPTEAMAAEVHRLGADAWLDQQLDHESIDDSRLESMIERYFPWSGLSTAEIVPLSGDSPWLAARHLNTETSIRQIYTNRVLYESMVEFWSDLLHVGTAVDKNTNYVNEYDWQVLRPHALGRFTDLLHASMSSSGMLTNLDNAYSTKWNPNENLGRELLELHTVGTGNYTEDDVKMSSLILTGQSIDDKAWRYLYRPDWHHTGPVRVMDFEHPNTGPEDGPAVLEAYTEYLATHPKTARRIATRLANRFVSDNPPEALVDRLSALYLESGTDIKPVLKALLTSEEFLTSAGQKVRRPAEYVVTMLRACEPPDELTLADPTWAKNTWANLGMLNGILETAGHLPRAWPAVNGYPDAAEAWLSSNLVRSMWNCAETVATRADKELTPRYTSLGLAAGQEVRAAARALTLRLTGWEWDDGSLDQIGAWLNGSWGREVPAPGDTLSDDDVENCQAAVRAVLSSPYMLVR